jgi:superfamily II DNA or RNA helicase
MDKIDRKNVLTEFESGKTEVIAAPLLLDEGVNIPLSDLAIVFASHSTKRQMIQRIGRVLKKKDNRIAKIIRIYTIETTEDLAVGAHEDFLEDIIDVADEIKTFTQDNIHELLDFFNI